MPTAFNASRSRRAADDARHAGAPGRGLVAQGRAGELLRATGLQRQMRRLLEGLLRQQVFAGPGVGFAQRIEQLATRHGIHAGHRRRWPAAPAGNSARPPRGRTACRPVRPRAACSRSRVPRRRPARRPNSGRPVPATGGPCRRRAPAPAPAPPSGAGGCAGAARSRRRAFRETAHGRSGSGPASGRHSITRACKASSSAAAQASSSSSSISCPSRRASKARPIMAAQVRTWLVRGESRFRRRPITSLMPSGMRCGAARWNAVAAPRCAVPSTPSWISSRVISPTNNGLPSVWLWIASTSGDGTASPPASPIMRPVSSRLRPVSRRRSKPGWRASSPSVPDNGCWRDSSMSR